MDHPEWWTPVEKDYYKLLGLPRTASADEIHAAYRSLMRIYHPDVYRGDPTVASVNTRALTEAYETLSDSARRREYDEKLYEPPPSDKTSAPEEDASLSPKPGTPSATDMENQGERTRSESRSPSFQRDQAAPFDLSRERPVPASHRHPQGYVSRRVKIAFVLFLVGSCVFVAVGTILPVSHSFGFTVGEGMSQFGSCLSSQEFPAGAKVAFSWTGSYVKTTPYNINITPPDIVVLDPSGAITFSETSWNGSYAFVSERGSYQFGVLDCEVVAAIFQVQFSGDYSTPLL